MFPLDSIEKLCKKNIRKKKVCCYETWAEDQIKSVACANRKVKTKYDTKIKTKLNSLLCLD